MKGNIILSGIFVLLQVLGFTQGLAVMSIDLGSEWIKIGVVSPGVPMEIALNKESKRKTLNSISFVKGERKFGDEAQIVGIRYPKNSFSYVLDLLGKPVDHPIVQLYKKRFPYYDIDADNERDSVIFKTDDGSVFSPEELVAQMLHKSREIAENFANQKIMEAVITVPGFFSQSERLALLKAAELANIKVLQLINDHTAIALNYGIFNQKNIGDSPQFIMFYDMGASSTKVTIVNYQMVKVKNKDGAEKLPQLSVAGIAYDRTLGGLEMQLRLQNYLGKAFDDKKKTKKSVFENDRAMAKLFKEAGRVKNVLSANTDHIAQIEGLLEDQDFRLQVTREKFEELNKDLFDRVHIPVKAALDRAGLTLDGISHVVLVGAGTRVPKVQDMLSSYVKKALTKNVNTDEAAALGAVYRAADLSKGFKVKKFVTRDVVLCPIEITFNMTSPDKTKEVKKVLFEKLNSYPQKKVIKFNKQYEDFAFDVNYGKVEDSNSKYELIEGNSNIFNIQLNKIQDIIKECEQDNANSKGLKAHFDLNDSGVLKFLTAEHVCENVEKVEEKPIPTEEKQNVSDTSSSDSESATTQKPENTTATKEASTPVSPATFTKKSVIPTSVNYGIKILKGDSFEKSLEKIHKLNAEDYERSRREKAINNLESFVIDTQVKLKSEEYEPFASPEESTEILAACEQVSDWLYEDGLNAPTDTYDDKLRELRLMTRDIDERVQEHKKKPEVLSDLKKLLNNSNAILQTMKNFQKDKSNEEQLFGEAEIEAFEEKVLATQKYYNEANAAVSSENPKEAQNFKVVDIVNKIVDLDTEIQELARKVKEHEAKKRQQAKESQKINVTSEEPTTPKDSTNTSESATTEESHEEL